MSEPNAIRKSFSAINTKLKKWLKAVSILLGLIFVGSFADQGIRNATIYVAVLAAALACFARFKGGLSFWGFGDSGIIKIFGISSFFLLTFGLAAANDRNKADEIILLAETDPGAALARMRTASSDVLNLIDHSLPHLVAQEKSRRKVEVKLETEKQRAWESVERQQNVILAAPDKFIKLEDVEWHKVGFDTGMKLSATIRNRSDFDVKDFLIRCDHKGNSGTIIDHNERVIFEKVEAGKEKRITGFPMGFIRDQVSSSSCYIKDFQFN